LVRVGLVVGFVEREIHSLFLLFLLLEYFYIDFANSDIARHVSKVRCGAIKLKTYLYYYYYL